MKPLQRSLCFLLLTAALGMAATTGANGPIGELQGTVLDSKGQPVPDATVTLQTSDGNHPHATHTDASGHFKFTRFETGQYDLRAYSKGMFSDWTKRVSIHSKKTTEVTLRMPPPADDSVTVTQ
jgi:protocatechuate 3,4-dioxygenase beta subunit